MNGNPFDGMNSALWITTSVSGCKADEIRRENYLSNSSGERHHSVQAKPSGHDVPRDTASALKLAGHPGILGIRRESILVKWWAGC